LVPGFARGTLAVDGIEVPVYLFAIVEIGVAQQVETMLAEVAGVALDPGSFLRQLLLQQSRPILKFLAGKEKLPPGTRRNSTGAEIVSQLVGQRIHAFIGLLRQACPQFARAHAGQTPDEMGPSGVHEFHLTRGGTGSGCSSKGSIRSAIARCGRAGVK